MKQAIVAALLALISVPALAGEFAPENTTLSEAVAVFAAVDGTEQMSDRDRLVFSYVVGVIDSARVSAAMTVSGGDDVLFGKVFVCIERIGYSRGAALLKIAGTFPEAGNRPVLPIVALAFSYASRECASRYQVRS